MATLVFLALVACATAPASEDSSDQGFVINSFELSPDGSELLMHVWGKGDTESIARIDLDGEPSIRQIAFDCRYAAGGAAYLPDSESVVVVLNPFHESLVVDDQWTPILRFIDNQSDNVMFEKPIVGAELVVGLAVSETGEQIYFVNRPTSGGPDLRRYDLSSENSTIVFDAFAENHIEFFRFVGIENDHVVISAGKNVDKLTSDEIASLGAAEQFAQTDLETPIIAYELTDDPSQLSLSQVYPTLHKMFDEGQRANQFWGTLIYLAAVTLREQNGIYYIAVDLPLDTEGYPENGIYRISNGSPELILDLGASIENFSITRDEQTIAVVYDATDKPSEIAIFRHASDGNWTRRTVPDALSRLAMTERCDS